MNKFAFYTTELGIIKIGYNDRAMTYLARADSIDAPDQPSPLSARAFAELAEYLAGDRRKFDIPYEFHGTAFQEKVWRALIEIPYGQTRSYRQIAEAIGNPKASRAVGMANNKNPISIIIPCHRVIGKNGALVGYGGGIDMKSALLLLERRVSGLS